MYPIHFTVFFFLVAFPSSYLADAKQPHKKVIILGAGLSGIVAGKTLTDEGINDFLILEGQDYIGGRIKQANISGIKVEEGANFIHYPDSEETAPLWKRKTATNLAGISVNTNNIIFRNEAGEQVFDRASLNTLLTAISKIGKTQEERRKENKKPISAREGLSLLGWTPTTAFQYVLEWFFYDFSHAKEVENLAFSTLDGSLEEGTPDFFVTDQRGMIGLYRDLYKGFESKIKLNKTVSGIKYDSNPLQVNTTDGETYTADYVLCTFSTGVLASDMVKFTPVLPDWKKQAIANQPLGTFTKIFVKFPKKFWDEKLYILFANNQRGYYPVIVNLDLPGAFPGSGLMMMVVTGDQAKKIENQTFNQTKAQIVQLLRGVYGKNINEPTDIYYGRWTKNLYVRGAYSDLKVGSDGTKNAADMQKNLGKLFFSGEGTSEEWYGYMQGAYQTGEKQAKAIASAINEATRIEPPIGVAVAIMTWFLCMN